MDPKSPTSAILPSLDYALVATSTEPQVFRRYKRRFFGYFLLCALALLVSWAFTAFAVVIDIVADYFNTTPSTVNWFATIWLFCNTIACPPAALAMRRSAKFSLCVGAALMLFSSWFKYIGTRYTSLGLAMFGQMLSGFASAFICNVPVLYSNEWFSPGTRATATAVGCMANVAGGTMGALVMPIWVNSLDDVPRTVLWTSIITTVCALPVFFIPKGPPTPPSAAVVVEEKVSVREELKWIGKSPEAMIIIFAFMVASGLWNSMTALLFEILEPYGYTSRQAGNANALLNSIGPLVSLILGPLADRTKKHLWIARGCAVLLAVSLIGFIWTPKSMNIALVYVMTSLISIAILGVWPIMLELMAEIVYPRGCEIAVCCMFAGVSFAGGVFSIVMIYMRDSAGTLEPAIYLQCALGISAAALYLSLGMFGRQEYVRMKRCGFEKAHHGPIGELQDLHTE